MSDNETNKELMESSTKEPEVILDEENIQMTVNESIDIVLAPPINKFPTNTPNPKPKQDKIPTLVFIVPYRDRKSHYNVFSENMKMYLRSAPPYKILYLHQADTRSFNRGAMKNIGFLVVKNLYPNDYKNITLVFNDIDTMPTKDAVIKYETKRGTIKHFYGFNFTLGGIVSINAADFELLNGFPNFWAWGYEDNLLQNRANAIGIDIDRSVFYKIMDPKIIHLTDTFIREVNRAEFDRFMQNTTEGINSIHNLEYNIRDDTGFVDVVQFETSEKEILEKRMDYDVRNGPAPFKNVVVKPRRVAKMKMVF